MSRKLHQIVTPIARQLNAQRLRLPGLKQGKLSPLLQVQIQRGEALLVLSFYQFLDQLGQVAPELQLKAWDTIIGDGNVLLDLYQRTGLKAWFCEPLAKEEKQAAYQAWCMLLFHLHGLNDNTAWRAATELLYRHYFLGMYKRQHVQKQRNKSEPEQLRLTILTLLRRHHGLGVSLKESFKQQPQGVEFALRWKQEGHSWQTLVSVVGERLKGCRAQAYADALALLQQRQPTQGAALPTVVTSRRRHRKVYRSLG